MCWLAEFEQRLEERLTRAFNAYVKREKSIVHSDYGNQDVDR